MVHDTNANFMKELCITSDADESAIQDALMRLFNVQTKDQTELIAVKGQVSRAKISVDDQALKAKSSDLDQALKASDLVQDQFSLVYPESKSKISLVQANCISIK